MECETNTIHCKYCFGICTVHKSKSITTSDQVIDSLSNEVIYTGNALASENIESGAKPVQSFFNKKPKRAYKSLENVIVQQRETISTGMAEFDAVLGNGIVRGCAIFIGGNPGAGKSTLIMQVCANTIRQGEIVYYANGEESEERVRICAERVGFDPTQYPNKFFLEYSNDYDRHREAILDIKPSLVIIDSAQVMKSANATSSTDQICYIALDLQFISDKYKIGSFLISHVTKDGVLIGSNKALHMVDVGLFLRKEHETSKFVCLSIYEKNRFGPPDGEQWFETKAKGLFPIDHEEE